MSEQGRETPTGQWSTAKAARLIKAAKSDKESSDALYREAMQYILPDREGFTEKKEGQQANSLAWDSTPTVSLMRAANRMSNDFTPQFQDWMEVGLGPAALQMPDDAFQQALGATKDDTKRLLETTTSIVNAIYNGPGFFTSSNELYLDWHFGQGGMQIMPNDAVGEEPVLFQSMPISSFYAYDGPNGKHDRWFFWHKVRADVVNVQWPDATLTDEITERAKEAKVPLLEFCAVCYRDYGETDPRKAYRYEVFYNSTKKQGETSRIVERQSARSPFVTPRHTKLAGENRGRGPALFALADIRTANKIVELTMRAAAIAVAGVYTVAEDGVIGNVAIKPAAMIHVRKNGGPAGPSLQRLDTPQRIDFGQVLLEKLDESIKKIIGDTSLPSEAGPIRTATEFVERARELISDQAGGLGRLYSEFIIPATQRIISILEDKQILQTDGLVIDQFLVEVRMTSPLAKGQAMQEVENVVRFIEMMTMLFGREMAMLEIDPEKVGKDLADRMDIPMTLRNTDEQKVKIKEGFVKTTVAQNGGDAQAQDAAVDEMSKIEEMARRG